MQRFADFASIFLISFGAALVALAVWGLWSSAPPAPAPAEGSLPSTLTGFAIEPTLTPLVAPTAAATAAPAESGPAAAISRIVAPRAGIDAPVATLGVDGEGVMESPDSPELVAWYDFSGRPGEGGNAIFAGHLDYANYGPAVFWNLRDLAENDEIEVVLADGSRLVYRVVSARSYAVAEAPVAEIIGRTEAESVTLITCGGSFDRSSRQYDQRLVVRAERVTQPV